MILEVLPHLNKCRIILASGSPRRAQILEQLGLLVEKVPSTFPEDLDKSKFTFETYVTENARQKALEVFKRVEGTPDLVIGSDTVVVHGERILEKPKDEAEAKTMLRSLSGESSLVYSGVALVTPNKETSSASAGSAGADAAGAGGDAAMASPRSSVKDEGGARVATFFVVSTVHFAHISDAEIDAYVATGEPMDKAGGFGIQGPAAAFIRGIEGCYQNIVGFPLHMFCRHLRSMVDRKLI